MFVLKFVNVYSQKILIFSIKNDIIIKNVNFGIFREEKFMYAKYKS